MIDIIIVTDKSSSAKNKTATLLILLTLFINCTKS
jgi:hypothetical protein